MFDLKRQGELVESLQSDRDRDKTRIASMAFPQLCCWGLAWLLVSPNPGPFEGRPSTKAKVLVLLAPPSVITLSPVAPPKNESAITIIFRMKYLTLRPVQPSPHVEKLQGLSQELRLDLLD